MKFILIFGPPAVGKMTVGQELEKITGLPLFHNHMTIELVLPFFDFSTKPFNRLVTLFRQSIFKEVAASDLDGMIFTLVWAFDVIEDHKYVDDIVEIFEEKGAEIFFVELEAELDARLFRNKTEHRLNHKSSKRDVERSEKVLLFHEEQHRFNSLENEIQRKNYIRIDNTHLTPEEVADKIKAAFF